MQKRIFFLFVFLIFCLLPFLLFSEEMVSEETASLDEVRVENIEDIFLLAAAENLGPTAAGFVSETVVPDDQNFIDPRVLRDFIESKGLIECRQKEGRLTIAADVRARWITAGEKVDGIKKRGSDTKVAKDRFKSEVNLFLDYVAPRGWVSTKLKWVNFGGVDGGTLTKTEMERAFIGFDIFEQGEEDFYIEVGRSKLDYLFESRVQFSSYFDGIHLYYTQCWPTVGTFVVHGGPFIVDSFTNHYAWVIETYVSRFRGTGLSFKYSLIDWHRGARTLFYGNDERFKGQLLSDNPRYRFIISQMLWGYEKKIDFLGCKTLYVYGAVLVNHDARKTQTTCHKKLNGAWYAGFTLGKLCKACDWSIDINYQSVQAQAIPEFDLAGIGHGNADGFFLSDAIIAFLLPDQVLGLFTNYKGWQFNLLYALTDSLSLRAKAEWSTPRNKCLGKDFFYKSFEMSVIYAF